MDIFAIFGIDKITLLQKQQKQIHIDRSFVLRIRAIRLHFHFHIRKK